MSVNHLGEVAAEKHGYFTAEIVYPYMEETMKCPHLRPWLIATCKVEDKMYVPSVFQLQEYCKTKSHKKCPLFLENIAVKREADCLTL